VTSSSEALRVDRWLVAARLARTRTLAQVAGRRQGVNGARATAHQVDPESGQVTTPRGRRIVIVLTLAGCA
jgi:ribosomal 50S subunit-recycling heat shock protein